MRHWLLKSEPSVWSWQQQLAAGKKGTHWDGVRNHLAKKHLLAMRKGDHAFFYHSNEGKAIVGILEVTREAYPDTTAHPTEPWVMVEVSARQTLPHLVSLAQVKAHPDLQAMSLVTCARLSVQPVTAREWDIVCAMGGL